MTLKTSLLITGDSAVAQKAVEDLKRSVETLGTSGRTAAAGLDAADRAQAEAATSARAMADAQNQAADAFRTTAAAAATAGGALGSVAVGAGATSGAIDNSTRRLRQHSQAVNDNQAAAARHAAGVRNLGQQFGDMAVMIQGGIDPIRAFATQAGQMGYAASEMGGKIGAVGRFLVGPWGIALTVAGTVLAPFIAQLFKTGEAARIAELATSSLGDAQSVMAELFGKSSSKIAEQNELLRLNARLKAINLRAEAAEDAKAAADAFRETGRPGLLGSAARAATVMTGVGGGVLDRFGIGSGSRDALALADRARRANGLTDSAARTRAFDAILRDSERADFSGSGIDAVAFREAVSKAAAARANTVIAAEIDRSLDAGSISSALARPDGKKPPKPKSTAARDEFGRDAADRIAAISSQFDTTAPLVRQIEGAKRQLTDLMDDLARRKPPGFEQLIADAREARGAIEAGINRPLDDFLQGQAQQLRQGQLIVEGRLVEAEAAKAIVAIERQRGPLTAQQRAEIVASVEALRGQERQLERIRAVQDINLSALRDMRDIVTRTIYEGPQSLAELPGRVFESFKRFSAEKIAEEWFGEMFRDARDQVLGANKVDQASNVIVASFARAATSADRLAVALGAPAAAPAGTGAGAAGGAVAAAGVAGAAGAATAGEDAPIVVTARRQNEVYGNTIAGVLTKLGIGKDTAGEIGRGAGKALAGAFEGQAASGVAGMLGLRQSGTGAAIGGAIGSFLPIPGGSIIGGLLGGTIGGLFGGSKAKFGTAVVPANGNQASAGGNDGSARNAATGLAGSVQKGLADIAAQLGGAVGQYQVSIGTYNGMYRVSTSGQTGSLDFGRKNKQKATLHDFGQDQAGAIGFGILDAIADGGITGVSAKVQQALRSSSSLDAAVKEALKVQEIEQLLGGTAGQIERAFRDLEATAKERVRVARQYGFDVVEIERRNAEDRTKLAQELARAQVGSLQSLVDELTQGSLFEGSAMEKIAVLNEAIAKAKADLDAGVDGAGDRLAGLFEQRLAASRAAYGTTSGFAADRSATLTDAQAAIARVNAQIAAANAKSDPALAATNQALDENNDQNAQIIAGLGRIEAALSGLYGGGGGVGGFLNLAQMAAV